MSLPLDLIRAIRALSDVATASRLSRTCMILSQWDPSNWLVTKVIERPFAIWAALPNGERHGSATVSLPRSTARFVYERGNLISVSQRSDVLNLAWLGSRRVEVVGPNRTEVYWTDYRTRVNHTAIIDSRDEYVRVIVDACSIRAIARPNIDFTDAAAIAVWFECEYPDSAVRLHASEWVVRGVIPARLYPFFTRP